MKAVNGFGKFRSSVVAVSVVAALGMTAACGGGGTGGGEEGTGPAADAPKEAVAERTEAAPGTDAPAGEKPAAPLTRTRLEKALLVAADAKKYTFEPMKHEDIATTPVSASAEECQPLADLFVGTSQPGAAAQAGTTGTGTDELSAAVHSIMLMSYEDDEARDVLGGVREAAGACETYDHVGMEYKDVEPLADPELGDEAASYRVFGDIEGTKMPMTFVVVREGSTIASFYSTDLLSGGKDIEVPEDLIEAQLGKLAKS